MSCSGPPRLHQKWLNTDVSFPGGGQFGSAATTWYALKQLKIQEKSIAKHIGEERGVKQF
jgi:hypothetical protein